MLTEKTVELASIIGRDLDKKGLVIKVKEGSILEKALQGTMIPSPTEVLEDGEIDSPTLESYRKIGQAIREMTVSFEFEGENIYNNNLDTLVKPLVPMLKGYIRLLKEVINPLVIEISTQTKEKLENLGSASSLNVSINEAYIPELLTNSQFLELVDQLRDTVISEKPLDLKPTFPELTQGEIRERLLEFPGLEQNIAAFLAEEEIEVNAYNLIFRQEGVNGLTLGALLNHKPNSLKVAIVTFLLAIKFLQTPIKGAVGTLEEYEKTLIRIRGQAGLAIFNYINRLRDHEKRGVLLLSRDDRNITVNPFLYRKWISEGGDVEALYGLTLNNQANQYRSIEEINQNRENLIKGWSTYRDQVTNKEGLFYYQKAKEILLSLFIAKIRDPLYQEAGLPSDQAIENFKNQLNFITTKDLEDLPRLVMLLVCRSKYPHLKAEKFFLDIDQELSRNTGLSIREGALLATINYLASWIAQDMTIIPKPNTLHVRT